MTSEVPRERAISASSPGTTDEGIDVWNRVFRDQTRQKLCFHPISGVAPLDRTVEKKDELRRASVASLKAVIDGYIPVLFDGYAKSERRLASLLWRWIDPKVDWPALMQCDNSAANVGTQIWPENMSMY